MQDKRDGFKPKSSEGQRRIFKGVFRKADCANDGSVSEKHGRLSCFYNVWSVEKNSDSMRQTTNRREMDRGR